MKKIMIVILLTTFGLFKIGLAQTQTFIMVDISKSIRPRDLAEAKQSLAEVLTGATLTNSTLSFGVQQELNSYQVKSGGLVYIIPFGDKSTTLRAYPAPATIQNIPGDVNVALDNSFPTATTDNQTYLELAVAKVAEYAKRHHIEKYDEVLITDNITDDFGHNGRPDYDDEERNLVQSFGTANNHVVTDHINIVKLKNMLNKDFVLKFLRVDVSKFSGDLQQDTIQTAHVDSNQTATIRIISFSGGRRNKEVAVPDQNVSISWSCTGYPTGGKYDLTISGYDGNTEHFTLHNLSNTTVRQQLQGGKYRITVSAANFTADASSTYIDVASGAGGWLILLVIVLGLAGVGWYLFTRNREKKLMEKQNQTNSESIFDKGKKSGKNTDTNTGYF